MIPHMDCNNLHVAFFRYMKPYSSVDEKQRFLQIVGTNLQSAWR